MRHKVAINLDDLMKAARDFLTKYNLRLSNVIKDS